MKVLEFLHFEKKKAILPIFLVIFLGFTIFLSNTYSNQVQEQSNEISENSLDILKLVVYNSSVNGTEQSIENQLASEYGKLEMINEKLSNVLLPTGASYGSEYVVNSFGTNFCISDMYSPYDPVYYYNAHPGSECLATELDLVFPATTLRLSHCANRFLNYFREYSKNANITELRTFVLSSHGQNIFNDFEECSYSTETLLDYEKMQEIYSKTNAGSEPPKIRLLSSTDIAIYLIILIAIGYLLSCIIIWLHRKNTVLKNRGKRIYLAIFVLFIIFFTALFMLDIPYFSTEKIVSDARIIFVVSLIMAYLATTIIWWVIGRRQESKLVKKIGRYKK